MGTVRGCGDGLAASLPLTAAPGTYLQAVGKSPSGPHDSLVTSLLDLGAGWPTKGFFLKLRDNKILPDASLAPK